MLGIEIPDQIRDSINGIIGKTIQQQKMSTPTQHKNLGEYISKSIKKFPDLFDELTPKQREILKQIISNLGDENYRNMDKDFFDYDHNSFIKSILVRDGERLDEVEPSDIQSITMEILQIEKLDTLNTMIKMVVARKNFILKEKNRRRK